MTYLFRLTLVLSLYLPVLAGAEEYSVNRGPAADAQVVPEAGGEAAERPQACRVTRWHQQGLLGVPGAVSLKAMSDARCSRAAGWRMSAVP